MTVTAGGPHQKSRADTRVSGPSRTKAPEPEPAEVDPEQERMLTTGQAAAIAGVDAVTMRRWCPKYRVPHITLPSGRRRFPEQAFLRWIRETFEMTEDDPR